mgnify:CR=1 FL=1
MTARARAVTTLLLAAVISCEAHSVAGGQTPEVHVARRHPIEYYLSLPRGWTKDREWPVLIALEGAGREFTLEHSEFVRARGDRPYIVVTPLTLSNRGNYDPPYPYPPKLWQNGTGDFDMGGLRRIIDDIHEEYGGRSRVYLTGFSAGGHLAWAMAFTHPELLAGVAPVDANYTGRGVRSVSTDSSRATLPIRSFQGDRDPHRPSLDTQWNHAEVVAESHGYGKLSRVIVPGGLHERMPERVFAWLDSLEAARRPVTEPSQGGR